MISVLGWYSVIFLGINLFMLLFKAVGGNTSFERTESFVGALLYAPIFAYVYMSFFQ